MNEENEMKRKALEVFLSGRQISGRGTEEGQIKLSKEDKELLQSPSVKDIKVRGKKRGKITPRQTFRIDESLWRRFQKKTRSKESKSASQVLREFIERYVGG